MIKKKRVCIFTLNGYTNYGNRLQLFALSRVLSRLEVEIFVYWPKSIKRKIREFFAYKTFLGMNNRKEIKLLEFTKKYIPITSECMDCDVAVIGSDQVWNPDFLNGCMYLLDAPVKGRKIAYAASVGTEKMSEEQKMMFRDNLDNFSNISVRERSAKVLLQPLTNREIEVVLDPTLLLDKSEYEGLEKRPENLKSDDDSYILCYILGNRDYESVIESFAKSYGCKIIYFSDKRDSEYGVEEFLYLIHHARLICTDSFHACVFSFLFERPFVAFRRSGKLDYMYTRIQNLMDVLQLKDREFNGKGITEKNLETDYLNSKNILKKEQRRSLDFLNNALGALKDE